MIRMCLVCHMQLECLVLQNLGKGKGFAGDFQIHGIEKGDLFNKEVSYAMRFTPFGVEVAAQGFLVPPVLERQQEKRKGQQGLGKSGGKILPQ